MLEAIVSYTFSVLDGSDVLARTRWHLSRCSPAFGGRSGVADLH